MLKKFDFKKLIPHVIAILFFLSLTIVYFSPIIQGKVLKRHDISTYNGMSQEIKNFNKETGETTLWTNSMFGGMPTYLISPKRDEVFSQVHRAFTFLRNEPMTQVFLYLIGFYIALLAFGVSPILAVVGAVAFGFSSYFFIIIEAGHSTKAFAIGYMAPIISGIYWSFKGKPLGGALLMAFFLTLQIRINHFQITYYTFLIVLIFGIIWLIKAIKEKNLKSLINPILFNLAGLILAVGVNATSIYLTYEYGKFSIRGPSELTHNAEVKTSGLDKDYATQWSYGIDESFTFLIPNFKGGASGGSLNEDSETYKLFEQAQGKSAAKKVIKQLPLYWGTQPVTSGPVYMGAIICFLFVLGLIVIKGPLKWWLLAATLLSILLGWGKNFMPLTEFFLDYFPGYNKFRTVSMTLVIAEFTMPLLGILAISNVFNGKISAKEFKKGLYWALGITGGLSLFFGLFSGMFSYEAASDAGMQQVLVDALRTDRQMMLRTDAFRSLFFILITALLVWAGYENKVDKKYLYPVLIALLLLDMWPVNKRYLNDDDFVSAKTAKNEFATTKADQFILKDSDPNFRVLNLTVSTFNDASTSYHHKSIGGYHGAKMRRYQELIDFYIGPEIQSIARKLQSGDQANMYSAIGNEPILNMLNTKYVILNPETFPLINTNSFGNVWYINNLVEVENADEEIRKIADVDLATNAIVDKSFANVYTTNSYAKDSTSVIKLTDYKPNYLSYSSNSTTKQVAVFSEIYYPKGWTASIDGETAEYFRANYILRALEIPAGEHKIEWQFKPKSYAVGNSISYASSILLLLICLGYILSPLWSKKEISL